MCVERSDRLNARGRYTGFSYIVARNGIVRGSRIEPGCLRKPSLVFALSDTNGIRLSGTYDVRTSMSGRGEVVKSDAFAKKRARPSEAHSTVFHALPKGDWPWNASLFKGMTPAGASVVRIDRTA